MSKHIAESENDLVYQCGLCGQKCEGCNYLKHIKEAHRPHSYVYMSRKTIYKTKHVKREFKTGLGIQCEYCSATFKRQNLVRKHIDRMHMRLMYQCDYCEYKCKYNIQQMHNHLTNHNTADLNKNGKRMQDSFSYKCSFCPVTIRSYDDFYQHFDGTHR